MKNMGSLDRIIRLIIGVALIAAGVILQLSTGGFWWLALIGAVPVITASISTCPLYYPFGINTMGKKD
jgi:uncharacterized membrane protein